MKRTLFLTLTFVCILLWECSSPQESKNTVNHAPEITAFSIMPATIKLNETTSVRCRAVDADGDVLSYNWYSPLGTIIGTDSVITWVAPEFQCEVFIRCTVTDAHGAAAADSARVTVLADTSAGG